MPTISITKGNKNTLLIACSHLVQAIFVVIKVKFLTNFFSIDAYAQYAILLSSMSVSVALSHGGIDFLLTKKLARADSRTDYLEGYLSRLLSLVLCIIFIAVLFQCFMFFAVYSSSGTSVLLLLSTLMFVVIMSINAALLAIYKGLNEIGAYAKGYLIGSVANSVTQCFIVWRFGDSGVSVVIVGSAFVQALVQIYWISQVAKKYSVSIKPKLVFPRRSYLKAGIAIAGSKSYTAGIGMLSQFGLIYYLLSFSGNDSVALFYLYNGLISQMANLVMIAISGSFFPILLREKIKSKDHMKEAIISQSVIISKIVFPILFMAVIFQETLLSIMASESFVTANSLFDYMICGVFLAIIKQSFDLSLQCYESNKYFVITASLGAITIVTIPSVLLFLFGISGFGIGLLVNSFIWLLVIPVISSRLYQFSLFNKDCMQILLTALGFILLVINHESIPVAAQYLIIFVSSLIGVNSFFTRIKL